MEEVLKRLANKSIMTLFVKGGSRVHSSFIQGGLADGVYLYMAPKLIVNGASLFMNETRMQIDQNISLHFVDVKMVGPDVRLHARFTKEE